MPARYSDVSSAEGSPAHKPATPRSRKSPPPVKKALATPKKAKAHNNKPGGRAHTVQALKPCQSGGPCVGCGRVRAENWRTHSPPAYCSSCGKPQREFAKLSTDEKKKAKAEAKIAFGAWVAANVELNKELLLELAAPASAKKSPAKKSPAAKTTPAPRHAASSPRRRRICVSPDSPVGSPLLDSPPSAYEQACLCLDPHAYKHTHTHRARSR